MFNAPRGKEALYEKVHFSTFGGVLFVGLFVFAAQPVLAEAWHENFPVPSGAPVTVAVQTGALGILNNLRFILGGNQHIRIYRIVSSGGTPEFVFSDASPHDVTLYFVQNPTVSEFPAFHISLEHNTGRDEYLTVTVIWDE